MTSSASLRKHSKHLVPAAAWCWLPTLAGVLLAPQNNQHYFEADLHSCCYCAVAYLPNCGTLYALDSVSAIKALLLLGSRPASQSWRPSSPEPPKPYAV